MKLEEDDYIISKIDIIDFNTISLGKCLVNVQLDDRNKTPHFHLTKLEEEAEVSSINIKDGILYKDFKQYFPIDIRIGIFKPVYIGKQSYYLSNNEIDKLIEFMNNGLWDKIKKSWCNSAEIYDNGFFLTRKYYISKGKQPDYTIMNSLSIT